MNLRFDCRGLWIKLSGSWPRLDYFKFTVNSRFLCLVQFCFQLLPSLHLAPLPLHRLRFKLMPLLIHLLPRYDRVILMDHRMLLWWDQVAVTDQLIPTLLDIWRLQTIFLPSRPLFPCSRTTILLHFLVFWPWWQSRELSIWTDTDSSSGRTNTSSCIRYNITRIKEFSASCQETRGKFLLVLKPFCFLPINNFFSAPLFLRSPPSQWISRILLILQ